MLTNRNLENVQGEIKEIAFVGNGICTTIGVTRDDIRAAVILHLICRAAGIDASEVQFGMSASDKTYAEAIANEVPL